MRARVRRMALDGRGRIIAVSDVHGNLPYLEGLLRKLRFGADDTLFLVGDLLEKGRHSLDTLRYVMELQRSREIHVVSGNCDWWYNILFDPALVRSQNSLWYINNKPFNLARQMCGELGYPVSMEMDVLHMRDALVRAFPAEWEFLRAMPEVIQTPHYTFVHGGLPEGPPESWDAWKCMKYDHFLCEGRSFPDWVICGHWPVMLYHDCIVDANPIIDRSRKIASIDGGCVLKDDGQLNALIIPRDGSEDFSVVSYDPFPTARVLDGQAASERSWYIRWGDAEVEVLSGDGEFCRCRHLRTGYEMDILSKYLRTQGGRVTTNDCTDYVLPLEPGDTVSVVETTSRGYFVKHRGISGWYRGRLELTSSANDTIFG